MTDITIMVGTRNASSTRSLNAAFNFLSIAVIKVVLRLMSSF